MENDNYADTGCELNPHCLNCPHPISLCPLYLPKKYNGRRIKVLLDEINMTKNGMSPKAISKEVGKTARQVMRDLQTYDNLIKRQLTDS